MTKKNRLSRRQRSTEAVRHRITKIAQQTLDDLHLDVIGFDACVLATRLLSDRLASQGIASTALDCIATATIDIGGSDLTAVLAGENDGPAHAVLVSHSLLIDLTIGQVADLDDRFPRVPPTIIRIPAKREPQFSIGLTDGGVEINYHFDTTRPPYFFGSHDWESPNTEAFVTRIKRMIAAGEGDRLKQIFLERKNSE